MLSTFDSDYQPKLTLILSQNGAIIFLIWYMELLYNILLKFEISAEAALFFSKFIMAERLLKFTVSFS